MREAAEILADREWPRLYDEAVLGANEVPAAAMVYAQDMYVERTFSEETAARIAGMRLWLTNEYEHNGLRADGARILGRLIDLARGRALSAGGGRARPRARAMIDLGLRGF